MSADMGKTYVTVYISRSIWYQFRTFCHANEITAARGLEAALREVLDRAGVEDSNPYLEEGTVAQGQTA